MSTVRLHFNKLRDAACRAAQGENKPQREKGKVELLRLLRSKYRLTPQDQNLLADFIEGKLNRKRGRPENLDEKRSLESLSKRVAEVRQQSKEAGRRMSLWDAVDLVIARAGYDHKIRSAAGQKLFNYISRSKRKRKSA